MTRKGTQTQTDSTSQAWGLRSVHNLIQIKKQLPAITSSPKCMLRNAVDKLTSAPLGMLSAWV